VLLGRYGTKESKEEHRRVLAEWEAAGKSLATEKTSDLTVNELLEKFLHHAEQYYRKPDGSQGREYEDYLLSLRPLRLLYGCLPCGDFGPLALEAVRRHIIHTPVIRKVLKRDESGKVMMDNDKRVWEEKTIQTRLSRKLVISVSGSARPVPACGPPG
jgi:hypothetical protein